MQWENLDNEIKNYDIIINTSLGLKDGDLIHFSNTKKDIIYRYNYNQEINIQVFKEEGREFLTVLTCLFIKAEIILSVE